MRWAIILWLSLISGVAHATAFTSNCASPCNWNAGASWTGGSGSNWPSSSADTATITAQQQVTVPNGTSITVGAVTLNAGSGGNRTVLQINGTLSLNGTMTLNGVDTLGMGDGTNGSTFDLNGNSVTAAANDNNFTFTGNASSCQPPSTLTTCAVVQSTGSAGVFSIVNFRMLSTWNYVYVTGLGDSQFGFAGSTTAVGQSYQHVAFNANAKLELEAECVGTNQSFTMDHVDFRNPAVDGAQEPYIVCNNSAGTATRSIKHVTWQRTSPTTANIGQMHVDILALTFDTCVLSDWEWQVIEQDTTVTNTIQSWHNTQGGVPMGALNASPATYTNNYFYIGLNALSAHPFGPNQSITVSGNVFENQQIQSAGSVPGTKWFCCGSASVVTWALHNNIFLGTGSSIDIDAAGTAMNIAYYNNTIYENQQGTLEGSPSATLMRVDHAGGFLSGGSVQFYNNLGANPCQFPSCVQNVLISLQGAQNNQVTLADYNTDFPIGASAYSPATTYTTGCASSCDASPQTSTISVGGNTTYGVNYAAHDFSANPNFRDATVGIAKWDTSLGGPGTETDAITQFLQMNGYGGTYNASFNVPALLAYVQNGMTPLNLAFRGTGRSGADIGALAVPSATGGIVQFLLKRDLDPASSDNTPMWLNEAA